MGRTRKPCPACKEVIGWRKADDICNHCRVLINEALETRKRLEKDKVLVEVKLGEAYHWNQGYYSARCDSDLREFLQRAMWRLATSISIPNPKWPGHKVLPLMGKCDGHQKAHRLIKKESAESFRFVHYLIKEIMKSCYEHGRSDGHDLLRRLATGDLAQNEFVEKTE